MINRKEIKLGVILEVYAPLGTWRRATRNPVQETQELTVLLLMINHADRQEEEVGDCVRKQSDSFPYFNPLNTDIFII